MIRKLFHHRHQGASIAECSSKELGSSWFDGTTGPRYVIWFFRDPSANCEWKYYERYTTNGFADTAALELKHKEAMLTLVAASAGCTGAVIKSSTKPKAPVESTIAKTTTMAPTTPKDKRISDSRCPIVVDVRTKAEWDAGHAPCAKRIEIPYWASLKISPEADLLALVGNDRTHPVHVHCKTGGRASQAKKILEDLGWTNVTNAGGWSQNADAIKKLCTCKASSSTGTDCRAHALPQQRNRVKTFTTHNYLSLMRVHCPQNNGRREETYVFNVCISMHCRELCFTIPIH